MSLPQAECPRCHEQHSVWRGSMTIHTTAAGEKCGTPWVHRPQAPPEPVAQKQAKPAPKRGKNGKRLTPAELEAEAKRAALRAEKAKKQAVVDAARRKANAKLVGLRDKSKPLDRSIYITRNSRPISGGLPGLGKGR
jgi:hypothetical protein